MIGSGELVQTLAKHRLIDRWQLIIHPLLLGSGKRLFREGLPATKLRLIDSKTSTKGGLILTYGLAEGSSEKVAVPVEEGKPASAG